MTVTMPVFLKVKIFEYKYAFFKKKWSHIISKDPSFNPNLSLLDENFSIGFITIKTFLK